MDRRSKHLSSEERGATRAEHNRGSGQRATASPARQHGLSGIGARTAGCFARMHSPAAMCGVRVGELIKITH